MFGSHFYHERIRNTVAVFGSLFNDMNIVRKDAGGAVISQMKVPLSYAPKRDFLARIENMEAGDDGERQIAIRLPRMSFEILSMEYDNVRQLPKMNQCVNADAVTESGRPLFSPVPYNIQFQLNIYAKGHDDALQVIEQIMPYFTPHYRVTIKPLSELSEYKEDVVITLDGTSFSDDYEASLDAGRTIIYTLDFSVTMNLFKNLETTKPVITEYDVGLLDLGGNEFFRVQRDNDPIFSPTTFAINEDETYTTTLTVTNAPASTESFFISSPASNGTASASFTEVLTSVAGVVTAVGSYTYIPDSDFNGTDNFTVSLLYQDSAILSSNISGTIGAVADILSNPITLNGIQDANVVFDLRSNDTFDSASATYTINTNGTNGIATIDSDGIITYVPNASFFGSDQVTYIATPTVGTAESAVIDFVISQAPDSDVAADPPPTIQLQEIQDVTFGTPYRDAVLLDEPVMAYIIGNDDAFVYNLADATSDGTNNGTASADVYVAPPLYNPTLTVSQCSAYFDCDSTTGRPYVSIPHDPDFNVGTAFSFESLIKPSAITNNTSTSSVLYSSSTVNSPSVSDVAHYITVNTDRIRLIYVDNGTTTVVSSDVVTDAISNGSLHHVVVTVDNSSGSGQVIFYLNGSVFGTTKTLGGTTISSTKSSTNGFIGGLRATGGNAGTDGRYFNGTMQAVCQYGKILTPQEVLEHYNAIELKRGIITPHEGTQYQTYVQNLSPTVYLSLSANEQGGAEVYSDLSGNGNDGTVSGRVQNNMAPLSNGEYGAFFNPSSATGISYVEIPYSAGQTDPFSSSSIMGSAVLITGSEDATNQRARGTVIYNGGDVSGSQDGNKHGRFVVRTDLMSYTYTSSSGSVVNTINCVYSAKGKPNTVVGRSYHYACTVDAVVSEVKFYRDGELISTETITNNPDVSGGTKNALIGASSTTDTLSAYAIIDNVSYHRGRVLTQAEVYGAYYLKYAKADVSNLDDYVARWTFDENDILGVTSTNYVTYLPFDADFVDTKGILSLTSSGGTPTYTTGIVGNGVVFDGSKALFNSTIPTELKSDTFTIDFYVRADLFNGQGQAIFYIGGRTATDYYGVHFRKAPNDEFVYQEWSGGLTPDVELTTSGQVSQGVWHRVTIVRTPSQVKYFIDDVLVDSTNTVGTIDYSNEPITFGARNYGGFDLYFTGVIDDWKYYDTALSANTIPNHSLNAGLDGTPVNSPTRTTGYYGDSDGALTFNGVDQYVSLPNSSLLRPNNVSVSCWIKIDSDRVAEPKSIFQGYNQSATLNYVSGYWFFLQSDNTLVFRIGKNTGGGNPGVNYQDARSDFPLGYNEWIHVAGTYDGSTIIIYVNGIEVARESFNIIIYDTPSYHLIGARRTDYEEGLGAEGGIDREFDGSIDDVRLYDRALTVSEVFYLANTTIPPKPQDMIAEYKFENNANDNIGTNNLSTGAVSYTANGWENTAISFSGVSSSYAEVQTTDFAIKTFTVSFWMKPVTPTDGTQGVVSYYRRESDGTNRHGWTLSILSSGYIAMQTYAGTSESERVDGIGSNVDLDNDNYILLRLGEDVWSHHCIVFEEKVGYFQATMYRDGYFEQTRFFHDLQYLGDEKLTVGALTLTPSAGSVTSPFEGLVDELRIYNRALTRQEVIALSLRDTTPDIVGETSNMTYRDEVLSDEPVMAYIMANTNASNVTASPTRLNIADATADGTNNGIIGSDVYPAPPLYDPSNTTGQGALYFDANTANKPHMEIPWFAGRENTPSMTFECLFKSPSLSSVVGSMVLYASHNAYSASQGWRVSVSDAGFSFTYYNPATTLHTVLLNAGAGTVTENEIHHVVITIDNSQIDGRVVCYLDGEIYRINRLDNALVPNNTQESGVIGATNISGVSAAGYNGFHFDGTIQAVCQYDYAFNYKQVARHYTALNLNRANRTPTASGTYQEFVRDFMNPSGHWTLSNYEQGGNSYSDYSGNGLTATGTGKIQETTSPLAGTGNAALFLPENNSGAYVTLPADASLEVGSGASVMLLCVPLQNVNSTDGSKTIHGWRLYSSGNSATTVNHGFLFSMNQTQLSIVYNADAINTNITVVSDNLIDAGSGVGLEETSWVIGKPYHVAVTIDNTVGSEKVTFYVNGKQFGEKKDLTIAMRSTHNTNSFIGAGSDVQAESDLDLTAYAFIDQVSYFNSIITENQISGAYSLIGALNVSNLDDYVARWSFDDILTSSVSTPTDMVSWYRFQTSSNDEGSSTNNLSNVGSLPSIVSGGYDGNNYTSLSGTNAWTAVASTEQKLQTFSASVWYSPNSANPTSQMILGCFFEDNGINPNNKQYGWWIRVSSNGDMNYASFDGGSGAFEVLNNNDAPYETGTDGWIQYCVTRDASGDVVLYANGREVNRTATAGTIIYPAGTEFVVGARPDDNNTVYKNFVDGGVDDVRFFDRSMSADEVAALYLESKDSVRKEVYNHSLIDGLDGTLINSPTRSTGYYGDSDGSLSFNGVDQYIELPESASLRPTSFTQCGWFKTTSVGSVEYIYQYSDPYDVPDDGIRVFKMADGGLQTSVGGNTGQVDDTDRSQLRFEGFLCDGQWHHYAVTFNSNVHTLYVDGVAVVTNTSYTGGIVYDNAGGATASIGARTGSGGPDIFFNGELDDMRLYDRALTGNEIFYLARTSIPPKPQDMIAEYKFEGDATDNIGTRDFTENGAPTYTTGWENNALTLNGTNQYLSSTTTAFQLQTFSFSVFAKWDNNSGIGTIFSVSYQDNANPIEYNGYFLRVGGTNQISYTEYNAYLFGDLGGVATSSGGTLIKSDVWCHYTVTRTPTSIKFYKDGELVGETTPTIDIGYNVNCEPRIGWRNTAAGSTDQWQGQIDELRFYDRELTASEVRSLALRDS